MSPNLQIDKIEEMALYTSYINLIEVWMDKQENIISVEDGNMKIDKTIMEMKKIALIFPEQEFILKYFFINGEGWKHFHPFENIVKTSEVNNIIIGIRTGEIKWINPDAEMLINDPNGFEEGTPEHILQKIIDSSRLVGNSSSIEIEDDIETLKHMEETLKEMENNLEESKKQTEEEEIMKELLQNDEVKKMYQNIKESKNMNTENKQEEVTEETLEEVVNETQEELKEEAKKVEEDLKEDVNEEETKKEDETSKKPMSTTTKVVIGVTATAVIAGIGYFLKNKFLNK